MLRFLAETRPFALRATRLVPLAALVRAPLSVLRADFDAEVTLRRTEAAPDFTDAFTFRETDLALRSAAAPALRAFFFNSAPLGALCVTLSTFAATVPSVEPIVRATSLRML